MPAYFWDVPGYVVGTLPPYGLAREAVRSGDEVFLHKETDVLYLFRNLTDPPRPYSQWKYWGRFYYTEDWEVYEASKTDFDRGVEWVMGGISEVTDKLDEVMDSIEEFIIGIQRAIGSVINALVDTGYTDAHVGIMAIEGFALAGVIAAQLGVGAAIANLLGTVVLKVNEVWEVTAPFRRSIEEVIERARTAWGNLGKWLHLDKLRTIDQILSLTWDDYYEKKMELIAELGKVSKELFGDVHVLNQWLSLAGMLWKDYASITGKTWGEQDMEWLIRTNEFLIELERDLAYYARNPEKLWIRIEDILVRPIYEQRQEQFSKWDKFRAYLDTKIDTVRELARSTDRLLAKYQYNLPDNIRDEVGPEILALRKSLREKYQQGLEPVLDKLDERLNLSDVTVSNIQRWRTQTAPTIEHNTMMLSDPSSLNEMEQTEQADLYDTLQLRAADRLTRIALPLLDRINMPQVKAAVEETYRSVQ